MNVLLVLDLRMYDHILDVTALCPLVLVYFASQDDPGAKYLAKLNETWYTFCFYCRFLSSGGEITPKNNSCFH